MGPIWVLSAPERGTVLAPRNLLSGMLVPWTLLSRITLIAQRKSLHMTWLHFGQCTSPAFSDWLLANSRLSNAPRKLSLLGYTLYKKGQWATFPHATFRTQWILTSWITIGKENMSQKSSCCIYFLQHKCLPNNSIQIQHIYGILLVWEISL